jgi:protein phosphatase
VSIAWHAAGATHTGRKRRGNEDSFRLDPDRGIFLVADGMGGHAAGEVASRIAADTVARFLADACDAGTAGAAWEDALRDAAGAAHREISRCCAEEPSTAGMGTTLTACVLDTGGVCRIGHIGDSRLYLLRDGALDQITRDHTWVQRELDSGALSPRQAASHPLSHILTRVLSADLRPDIDVLSLPLLPGDRLLLATDGLYNMLPDSAIQALLATSPLAALPPALNTAANRAGGADNITVVAVEVAAQ